MERRFPFPFPSAQQGKCMSTAGHPPARDLFVSEFELIEVSDHLPDSFAVWLVPQHQSTSL
jgi:hypothetical protein